MNSRRSYLESMNAGRPRRASTSLEQLNRTLDELEGRIESASAAFAGDYPAGPASARHVHDEPARPLERNRGQEEELPRQIAFELESLRRELRHQFGGNLKNEFAALRSELAETLQSAQPTRQLAALSAEFERLAGMIHHLGERDENEQVGLLRNEMEQVKNALDLLAREDTLRSADRRWDDFDRRWEEFTARVENATARGADHAGIADLGVRLEEIGNAVGNLPNSTVMRSLEDKLRILASAVDQFAYQQGQIGPEALNAIDERLNEISRAIAAAGPAGPGLDSEVSDRLEARISALARQIGELAEMSAPMDIGSQIETLNERIDQLAQSADGPSRDIARLGEQITEIARHLESGLPEHERERLFRHMDERLERVSTMLEQRHEDAMMQGRNLMLEMEQRLYERTPTAPQDDGAGLHHVESRLEEISARLEQASERAGILDADLVASLETQISALSRQLSEPGPSEPPGDNIEPRLEAIEQAIARNREELVEATRQAAERAVEHIVGAKVPATGDVDELAQDLRSLQDLAQRSDERNSRTFEAIHDTLIKIVDRLAAMANGDEEKPADEADHERIDTGRIETGSTPPLEPELDDPVSEQPGNSTNDNTSQPVGSLLNPRTPASAAQEAAAAARADDEQATKAAGPKSSILGKLTGAIGKRKQKAAPLAPIATRAEPQLAADELGEPIDPLVANQPLEPGSQAPDLNAIMRRVRDERKDNDQQSSEVTAKSDFIAAARRAARAAAAEANMAKRDPAAKDKDGKLAIGRLFKHKKALTLGIALIALTLTGFYVAPRYLAPGDGVPVTQAAGPGQTVSLHSPEAEFSSQAIKAASRVVEAASENQEPAMAPDIDSDGVDEADAASTAAPRAELYPVIERDAVQAEEGLIHVAATDPSLLSPEFSAGSQTLRAMAADGQESVEQEPAAPAIDFEIPQAAGPDVLRQAAADGDPRALYEIARRYQQGRGIDADMTVAATWFERAAERGLAPAQYQIGNIYEKGLGVDRDIDAAMTWYERAAEKGNASAMHNLAVLHAMGAAGRNDNRQAARWFHEAADLGITDSQFNLGILAAKGVGVEQDLVEAYKWFDIVARSGDSDAAEKRDEVGEVLGDDERERAQQTAALWQAREMVADANHVDVPGEWTEDIMETASVDVETTVRSVQTLLNELGYEAGPEDGMFGARTATAIASFQTDNGLEPSGEIDNELVRALLAKQ